MNLSESCENILLTGSDKISTPGSYAVERTSIWVRGLPRGAIVTRGRLYGVRVLDLFPYHFALRKQVK